MNGHPLPPIVLDEVVENPEAVRELARSNGPYWQPGRMLMSSGSVRETAGGTAGDVGIEANLVGPVFRGDWAFGEPLIDGADPLLHHRGFIDAAAAMYRTDQVVPEQVYVNLTTPVPRSGFSHTDIPEFRGAYRSNTPAWLLSAMGVSGLFEAERIPIVTAVAWFYRGDAGGLRYWPTGPDGPSVHHTDTWNSAVVGDNDFMPHEVQRVGPRGVSAPDGLTIDSELAWNDQRWEIIDRSEVVHAYDDDQVRLSLSWKAKVYADAGERRRAEEGRDALTLDEILGRFEAHLAAGDPSEPLAGRSPTSADLRRQLSARFTAYRPTPAPV
ncbi:MAG: hypothetical protein KDB24_14490 [Microthrixaceae bacterium]|nr:hypothetical protein [Microthrixaceae bacterium]